MERVLGLKEVEEVLRVFYGLNHEVAKRWAEYCISKNWTWDHVHAMANLAIYRNSDIEEVFKLFESWNLYFEGQKDEVRGQDSS